VGAGGPRAHAGDHLTAGRGLLSRVRNRGLAELFRRLLPVKSRADLVHLGTDYGGYIVPGSLIHADWICYSGGVGEDVSFDVELIDRYGCAVFAFDPTPRAVAFAEATMGANPRFHFHPFGLWSSDGEVAFFAPQDPAHVSHSIGNLQRTSESITVPVRSLPSIMGELGHDRIDLLKLDIEGAEHEVVASMLETGIRPRVLCMEIDQPAPARQVLGVVRLLRSAQYDLVAIDRWNYTFVAAEATRD
jgi:FkbM family methyltransferase